MNFQARAKQRDGGEAVESSAAKFSVESAVGCVEQQRIDEQLPSVAFDFVVAGVACERPSLAARGATGGHPINQRQICGCAEFEGLALVVARFGEALHRVGREDEQRVVADGGGELV